MPKKGKQTKRGKARPRASNLAVPHPIPFQTVAMLKSFKVRYYATAIGSTTWNIQPFQLINSWFCSFVDATHVQSCVQAIRFRFAEAWVASSNPATAIPLVANTLMLGWEAGTNFGRDYQVQDLSMGATSVAHVKLLPIKGSTSMMWQESGGNQPWVMVAQNPVNTVLDICCDVILNMGETSATSNTPVVVVSTPNVGSLYFTKLVSSAGSNTWLAQGVSDIA